VITITIVAVVIAVARKDDIMLNEHSLNSKHISFQNPKVLQSVNITAHVLTY